MLARASLAWRVAASAVLVAVALLAAASRHADAVWTVDIPGQTNNAIASNQLGAGAIDTIDIIARNSVLRFQSTLQNDRDVIPGQCSSNRPDLAYGWEVYRGCLVSQSSVLVSAGSLRIQLVPCAGFSIAVDEVVTCGPWYSPSGQKYWTNAGTVAPEDAHFSFTIRATNVGNVTNATRVVPTTVSAQVTASAVPTNTTTTSPSTTQPPANSTTSTSAATMTTTARATASTQSGGVIPLARFSMQNRSITAASFWQALALALNTTANAINVTLDAASGDMVVQFAATGAGASAASANSNFQSAVALSSSQLQSLGASAVQAAPDPAFTTTAAATTTTEAPGRAPADLSVGAVAGFGAALAVIMVVCVVFIYRRATAPAAEPAPAGGSPPPAPTAGAPAPAPTGKPAGFATPAPAHHGSGVGSAAPAPHSFHVLPSAGATAAPSLTEPSLPAVAAAQGGGYRAPPLPSHRGELDIDIVLAPIAGSGPFPPPPHPARVLPPSYDDDDLL
jgi:hypothetical protein